MSSDAPILVFDGVCVLCSRSVQFVLRHDRERKFRFATMQSETGRCLMIENGFDPTQPASVLLIENGETLLESSAALRVLKSFGGGWKVLAMALRVVPRKLRDAIYRAVARRRYRWFGKTDACYLPQPADAGRFLD